MLVSTHVQVAAVAWLAELKLSMEVSDRTRDTAIQPYIIVALNSTPTSIVGRVYLYVSMFSPTTSRSETLSMFGHLPPYPSRFDEPLANRSMYFFSLTCPCSYWTQFEACFRPREPQSNMCADPCAAESRRLSAWHLNMCVVQIIHPSVAPACSLYPTRLSLYDPTK